MNKLGIWGLVIAVAFVVGVLSSNPVVEAAQSGWQAANTELEQELDDLFGDLGDLENAIDAETIEREAGDADVLLEANNDLTVHEDDVSSHGIDSLTLEFGTTVSGNTIIPSQAGQSFTTSCQPGTVMIGWTIFVGGINPNEYTAQCAPLSVVSP